MNNKRHILYCIGAVFILLYTKYAILFVPVVGAFLNTISLSIFLVDSIFDEEYRSISVALAILFVSNTVQLTIGDSNVLVNTIILYVPLFGLGLTYWILLDRPHKKIIKPYMYIEFAVMAFIGVVIGCIGYWFIPKGSLLSQAPLWFIFIFSPAFAIAEELIFRRLIQFEFHKMTSDWIAIPFTALIFATVTTNRTPQVMAFGLLSGIVLALIFARTKSVMHTTILNASMKITFLLLTLNVIK
jgi:membrane protease YdiL (CAAX protease family)